MTTATNQIYAKNSRRTTQVANIDLNFSGNANGIATEQEKYEKPRTNCGTTCWCSWRDFSTCINFWGSRTGWRRGGRENYGINSCANRMYTSNLLPNTVHNKVWFYLAPFCHNYNADEFMSINSPSTFWRNVMADTVQRSWIRENTTINQNVNTTSIFSFSAPFSHNAHQQKALVITTTFIPHQV